MRMGTSGTTSSTSRAAVRLMNFVAHDGHGHLLLHEKGTAIKRPQSSHVASATPSPGRPQERNFLRGHFYVAMDV